MYIKKLTINSNGDVIREIEFSQDVNIITTPNNDDTGNNVGKTTVIDLIDIALGAEIQNKQNKFSQEVSDLISNNNVFIELELKKETTIHTLKVNLSNKTYELDSESYNVKSYRHKVKELLFENVPKNITLRKLIKRFLVLSTPDAEERIIRYLDYNESRNKEMLGVYEAAYGYYLNSDEKDTIETLFDERIKQQALEKTNKSSILIKDANKILDNTIGNLEGYTESNDVLTRYAEKVDELQNLYLTANILSEDIENIGITVEDSVIGLLIEELGEHLPDKQAAFEKIVEFNQVREKNKKNYLTAQLQEIQNTIQIKENEIAESKKQLAQFVNFRENSFDLNEIKKNIEKKFSENIKKKKSEEKEINVSENDIQHIFNDETLAEFNKYLSEFSELITGSKYAVKINSKMTPTTRAVPIEFVQNFGSGTGRLHQLEFAFIAAIIMMNVGKVFPKFILQDINEVNDDEPFEHMFEISKKNNIQLIIPILGTKISNDLKERIPPLLVLSQDNKLFKL